MQRRQGCSAERDAPGGGECRKRRMSSTGFAGKPLRQRMQGESGRGSEGDTRPRSEQSLIDRVLHQEDAGQSDKNSTEPDHPVWFRARAIAVDLVPATAKSLSDTAYWFWPAVLCS